MNKIIISMFLLILPLALCAQTSTLKKDTIYYLVDTASTPVKDRMFIAGQEGNFYGYRLTCSCYPWQSDAFFIYGLKQKAVLLTGSEFNKLRLTSLRQLIKIAAMFGNDRKRRNIFYFIEKQNDSYFKHQVFLSEPVQPLTSY